MLGINSDLPFFYTVFCILLGLGYAFLLYKGERITSKKLRLGLFVLRTILSSLLAFLLLNPIIRSTISSAQKPIIIIAKDTSESIKEEISNKLEFVTKNLKDFEVFLYSFSDKVYDGISEDNNGLKTNYSYLFSDLSNKFENRNVAGVIMASDGCYNTGLNPEYLSYDFPVYSIALGDTVIYKDIRIDNVLKNDIAFFGNTFPLDISLGSSVNRNENSRLKIWNNGVKLHDEPISFLKDQIYDNHVIYLPANNIGLQTYTIELDALNQEKNISNNVFKIYIDVIDSRYNILILKDRNSPDISAYKSSIERNRNYKIDIKDISDNIVIQKYQLVVIFGVRNIPSSILSNDVPLLIFNASESDFANLKAPIIFTDRGGGINEIKSYKNQSFSKFSFSTELLALIADAPPLFSSFGRCNLNGNVDCVINQKIGRVESDNPIIMIQELDSRKISYILAEGWWKWKLYDYSINNNNNAFNELFGKLTQYLVLQEDKSLFRLEYNKQYDENNEIIFRAALYNESYELVNNKEVNLKLTDKNGREYDFQFLKEGSELIAKLGILEVGHYNFSANVKGSDLVKKGVFDVKKIQLEQLGLSANHHLLRKISDLSGGEMFYLDNIEGLVKTIQDSKRNKKIISFQESLHRLIDIPLILFLLLFLVSFEWFLRKYNGLI